MSDIPQEWVEKAARAICAEYPHTFRTGMPFARGVAEGALAVVLSDVRRAIAEEIAVGDWSAYMFAQGRAEGRHTAIEDIATALECDLLLQKWGLEGRAARIARSVPADDEGTT